VTRLASIAFLFNEYQPVVILSQAVPDRQFPSLREHVRSALKLTEHGTHCRFGEQKPISQQPISQRNLLKPVEKSPRRLFWVGGRGDRAADGDSTETGGENLGQIVEAYPTDGERR